MTDELFQIDESLSPRLRWMRENRIEIVDSGLDHEPGEQCEITGNRLYRYWAVIEGTVCENEEAGGDTEDEAIVALAKKLNLKLWNE